MSSNINKDRLYITITKKGAPGYDEITAVEHIKLHHWTTCRYLQRGMCV